MSLLCVYFFTPHRWTRTYILVCTSYSHEFMYSGAKELYIFFICLFSLFQLGCACACIRVKVYFFISCEWIRKIPVGIIRKCGEEWVFAWRMCCRRQTNGTQMDRRCGWYISQFCQHWGFFCVCWFCIYYVCGEYYVFANRVIFDWKFIDGIGQEIYRFVNGILPTLDR